MKTFGEISIETHTPQAVTKYDDALMLSMKVETPVSLLSNPMIGVKIQHGGKLKRRGTRKVANVPVSKLRRKWLIEGSRTGASRGQVNTSGIFGRLRSKSSSTLLLRDHGGIPVRETLQALYVLRRRQYLLSGSVLVLSIILLFGMLHFTLDTRVAYEQEEAVRELLVDEEFESANYKKNFLEIRTIREWWEWQLDPLMKAAYPRFHDHDETQRAEEWIDYTQGPLRLVGGMRFRQNSVRNDSCTNRRRAELGLRIDTKGKVCYSGWKASVEQKEAYGRGKIKFQYNENLSPQQGMPGGGPGIFAQYDYGRGGFEYLLPPLSVLQKTNETARGLLKQLRRDGWLEHGSRFASVELSFFNTMTSLLTVAEFQIEISRSGFVQPFYRIRSVAPLMTHASIGAVVLRFLAEVGVVFINIGRLINEARKFCRSKPYCRYFKYAENAEELVILSCYTAFFTFWYSRVIMNPSLLNFDSNTQEFKSYLDVAEDMYFCWLIAAIILVVGSLKFFRFLSLDRRMSVLWLSLHDAGKNFIYFGIALLIILSGFAVAAQFAYGSSIKEYNTLGKSMISMFRGLVGENNMEQEMYIAPAFSVAFYFVWSLLTKIVALNMFIAIVNQSFTEVSNRNRREMWKSDLLTPLFDTRKRIILRWYKCCEKRKVCCRGKEYKMQRLRRRNESIRKMWSDSSQGKENEFDVSLTPALAHYLAEDDWLSALSLASDRTRRREMVTEISSLFGYFESVYVKMNREGRTNDIMGIDELCAVTLPREYGVIGSCDHKHCPAADIVEAYRRYKHVIVFTGNPREAGLFTLNSGNQKKFNVIKINKQGAKQRRFFVLDLDALKLRSYDTQMRLRIVLPLWKLQQLEESRTDPCRVKITFQEGVYSFCTVIFESKSDLISFVEVITRLNDDGLLSSARREDVSNNVGSGEVEDRLKHIEGQLKNLTELLTGMGKTTGRTGHAGQTKAQLSKVKKRVSTSRETVKV
eukprot:g108.t1